MEFRESFWLKTNNIVYLVFPPVQKNYDFSRLWLNNAKVMLLLLVHYYINIFSKFIDKENLIFELLILINLSFTLIDL